MAATKNVRHVQNAAAGIIFYAIPWIDFVVFKNGHGTFDALPSCALLS